MFYFFRVCSVQSAFSGILFPSEDQARVTRTVLLSHLFPALHDFSKYQRHRDNVPDEPVDRDKDGGLWKDRSTLSATGEGILGKRSGGRALLGA